MKQNISVEIAAFIILWIVGTALYLKILAIVLHRPSGFLAVPYWILLIILFSKLYNVRLGEVGFKIKVPDVGFSILYPLVLGLTLPMIIGVLGLITNTVKYSFVEELNLLAIIVTLITYLIWAFGEEAVFRGYVFHRLLMEKRKLGNAILINSALFAMVHVFNVGFNVIAFFQLIIGGIILSLLIYYSKSLISPTLFHCGWNFMLTLLGFPVSGNVKYLLLKAHVKNFEIIFGGEFGPEGGLAGLAAILLGLCLTMILIKRVIELKF